MYIYNKLINIGLDFEMNSTHCSCGQTQDEKCEILYFQNHFQYLVFIKPGLDLTYIIIWVNDVCNDKKKLPASDGFFGY